MTEIADGHELDRVDDVNNLNKGITALLMEAYNQLCPLRVVRISKESDIVSDSIERIKKRRKRAMREFNKTKQDALLQKIKKLDVQLKRTINSTRKDLIQKKMQSSNKSCFWDVIKKLQGDSKPRVTDSLNIDGHLITDPSLISESFADFFANKVNTLSDNTGPYQWVRDNQNATITETELISAVKKLKSKLCTGHDGVPLKIVKHATPAIIGPILRLMNIACITIPADWKLSIVVPLFKAKERTSLANYRPISNLVSISKIFEKVILEKLDNEYYNIEGQHQHGFRKGRGTVTALLELQHSIAKSLDSNLHVSTYSVDMTAAFDLLKPNIFHQAPINNPIMNILMDFMTNRTFKVQYNSTLSQLRSLNVGCVQGSILGPKLFGIYCRELPSSIPDDATVISYADDTYVVNSASSKAHLVDKTELSIKSHLEYIKGIGMVVNNAKTEILYSSR